METIMNIPDVIRNYSKKHADSDITPKTVDIEIAVVEQSPVNLKSVKEFSNAKYTGCSIWKKSVSTIFLKEREIYNFVSDLNNWNCNLVENCKISPNYIPNFTWLVFESSKKPASLKKMIFEKKKIFVFLGNGHRWVQKINITSCCEKDIDTKNDIISIKSIGDTTP